MKNNSSGGDFVMNSFGKNLTGSFYQCNNLTGKFLSERITHRDVLSERRTRREISVIGKTD